MKKPQNFQFLAVWCRIGTEMSKKEAGRRIFFPSPRCGSLCPADAGSG